MNTIRQWYLLLNIGLILCVFGCDTQPGDVLLPDNIPTDNTQIPDMQQPPMTLGGLSETEAEATFNSDLLPILTADCAFAGCHVAGGPKNIDLSTYQAFIRGGDTGAVFIPGDSQGSSIIDEIVSGRMPLGGTKYSDAKIKIFTDWIDNQAETVVTPVDESTQPRNNFAC